MSGVGCANGVNFSRGAVASNLVASISPADTSQTSPGAVVLTASATGGTGASSWAWMATYADGTSAAALLSGSGSTRTLTTTLPGQAVRVVATATDAAGQTSAGSAHVAVVQPAMPTLTGPSPSTVDAPGSGSVTFSGATGYGSLSYSATLSKPSGSAATLSGSGLGAYTFTADVEGAYAVTLTLTDSLGRTAAATGIVSLVSAGAIWTEAISEDFTTYTAASVSRTTQGTTTLNLVQSGTTRYVGTLGTTGSGSGSGGINASGLFVTLTSGFTRMSMTFAPSMDTTKWHAYQWLLDIPTLSGTSVNGGTTTQSSSAPSTGTEIAVASIQNNATSGYDIEAFLRLSNVTQTPSGVHVSGLANPGRVCVTQVCRGKQVLALVHDSDTFVPMASIDVGPLHAAMEVCGNDPVFSSSYALLLPTPNVGVRVGGAAGTYTCRAWRALYATPRSN